MTDFPECVCYVPIVRGCVILSLFYSVVLRALSGIVIILLNMHAWVQNVFPEGVQLRQRFCLAPTLKVEGAYCFGLVRPCVCASVRPSFQNLR